MIFVKNQQVYRIDDELFTQIMMNNRCHLINVEIGDMVKEEISNYTPEPGYYIINEQHYIVLFQYIRGTSPSVRKLMVKMYNEIHDIFMERIVRSGDDISKYEIDMGPEDVKNHVHAEFGSGFSFDDQDIIECEDCTTRVEKTHIFFNAVIKVQLKANRGEEVVQEDFEWLFDLMPDMALGYPKMIIAIDTDVGRIVIGPKDTAPSFDDDLPMPTHVIPSTLN